MIHRVTAHARVGGKIFVMHPVLDAWNRLSPNVLYLAEGSVFKLDGALDLCVFLTPS